MTEIENVRKRPGMWIGDTETGSGVLHMLLDVLANSFDQHLAGRCSRASIEVASDGTITLGDDGPGLSREGSDGLPPLHEMLTCHSKQPTVDGHRPHAHLWSDGVGLFVVNALSERFAIQTVRAGLRTTAAYERGNVVEEIASAPSVEPTGTRVRFRPDPLIFKYPRVPRVDLVRRVEDLSFLAPRFALSLKIDADQYAAGGLAARVALRVPCEIADVATHVGTYETPSGPIDVEVALHWRTAASEPEIDSFVNLGRTPKHGSHVDGLLDAVREKRLSGLVAAVSVVLADVKFGRPDRNQLESAEAREPVALATKTALTEWARRKAQA